MKVRFECKCARCLCYVAESLFGGLSDLRGSLFSPRPSHTSKPGGPEGNALKSQNFRGTLSPACDSLGTNLMFYLYATKIKQHENLTDEAFCSRKFPDLRILFMGNIHHTFLLTCHWNHFEYVIYRTVFI